jgi:hypothetical protein
MLDIIKYSSLFVQNITILFHMTSTCKFFVTFEIKTIIIEMKLISSTLRVLTIFEHIRIRNFVELYTYNFYIV